MWKIFYVIALASTFIFGDSAFAQTQKAGLRELLAQLPALVHQKTMDFGPYSQAVLDAYTNDPTALYSAVPQLKQDLEDTDPWAQFETLAIIHGLAVSSGDSSLILMFSDQLERLLTQGTDATRSIATATVSDLGSKATSQLTTPLFLILRDKTASDQTVEGAAYALMATRPTDGRAQAALVDAVDDKERSETLRCGLLSAAGNAFVGQQLLNKVISVANTSEDKALRDTAISTAEKIGSRALIPIQLQLQDIANNPSESAVSRQTALHALKVSALVNGH